MTQQIWYHSNSGITHRYMAALVTDHGHALPIFNDFINLICSTETSDFLKKYFFKSFNSVFYAPKTIISLYAGSANLVLKPRVSCLLYFRSILSQRSPKEIHKKWLLKKNDPLMQTLCTVSCVTDPKMVFA